MRDFVFNKVLCLSAKRHGIIRISSVGNSALNRGKIYESIVEVEEVKRINNLTKIRIIKVSGNMALNSDLPEWVNNDAIEWNEE